MSPLSLTLMSLTVAVLSLVAGVVSQDVSLPAQSVYIQPSSFAVLGSSYDDWRVNSSMMFDPSNSSAPIFQIFDPDFLNILGSEPSLRLIASNPDFAFAHEAPVWVPDSDEVFFTSNAAGHLGHSGLDQNNQMGKISLQEVAAAIRNGTGSINVTVTSLELDDAVQMTNGGTGPYKGNLLIMNQGRGELPANMVAINPYPPYNVTVLLDNFFGRQFNSLNDVKVHPSGEIFFTDVAYGFYQYFKPEPLLPNQVYRFNPDTGLVRVAADDVMKPNGIAFNADYSTLYIYAYDVQSNTLAITNRRVFAYVDTGAADGVAVDTQGNVWGGCGDGVQVWNSEGKLLGKFYLGKGSSNFAFAGQGRVVLLSETEIYYAQVDTGVEGVDLVHT
ncbi:D-lactonohydrolase-like protein [Hymenopellis radicata]|nr:D-lactonohydrolase-like protein [Hymenopellis radicata]